MKEETIEKLSADWILNKENVRILFEKLEKETDGDFKQAYVKSSYNLGAGWKLSLKESYGGEGLGDERWVVMKLVSPAGDESFWEIPGYYNSGNGSEFEIDNTFEVSPVEETVVVWKAK